MYFVIFGSKKSDDSGAQKSSKKNFNQHIRKLKCYQCHQHRQCRFLLVFHTFRNENVISTTKMLSTLVRITLDFTI